MNLQELQALRDASENQVVRDRRARLFHDAVKMLEEAQEYVEGEFTNEGVCLVCRALLVNHTKMGPSCWVQLLLAILGGSHD